MAMCKTGKFVVINVAAVVANILITDDISKRCWYLTDIISDVKIRIIIGCKFYFSIVVLVFVWLLVLVFCMFTCLCCFVCLFVSLLANVVVVFVD